MNAPTLIVNEVARHPAVDAHDKLEFSTGVNTIVGRPNTGKTKWLQTLDLLLGSDKDPLEILDDELGDKYESASALLTINGEQCKVERRWRQYGLKTKVILNEEAMGLAEFGNRLLEKLSIPVIKYPQGNPYSTRTWPSLGWRSLFRHLYRRQHFWSDLADKQPDSEQHACLLQFLGLAENVFSEDFADLADKVKTLSRLQAEKDAFVRLLHEVAIEIIEEKDLTVALTAESIRAASTRIQAELDRVVQSRRELLRALKEETLPDSKGRERFEHASEQLLTLQSMRGDLLRKARQTEKRISEIQQYRESVEQELGRLERALAAGTVLADLKVTHCPACDRTLSKAQNDKSCHVCGRPVEMGRADAQRRINFEKEQLESERSEADSLLSKLKRDITEFR